VEPFTEPDPLPKQRRFWCTGSRSSPIKRPNCPARVVRVKPAHCQTLRSVAGPLSSPSSAWVIAVGSSDDRAGPVSSCLGRSVYTARPLDASGQSTRYRCLPERILLTGPFCRAHPVARGLLLQRVPTDCSVLRRRRVRTVVPSTFIPVRADQLAGPLWRVQ